MGGVALIPAGVSDFDLADVHGVQEHRADTVVARVVGLAVELFDKDKIAVVDDVQKFLNASYVALANDLMDWLTLAGWHV